MNAKERERKIVEAADKNFRILLSAYGNPVLALAECCVANANLIERVRDLEAQLAKRSIPDGI